MNRKLRVWQEDMRKAQGQPSWGEWFGDQAQKIKQPTTPAHIQHRSWKP